MLVSPKLVSLMTRLRRWVELEEVVNACWASDDLGPLLREYPQPGKSLPEAEDGIVEGGAHTHEDEDVEDVEMHEDLLEELGYLHGSGGALELGEVLVELGLE